MNRFRVSYERIRSYFFLEQTWTKPDLFCSSFIKKIEQADLLCITVVTHLKSKGDFFIRLTKKKKEKKEICKQEWTGTATFLGWSSANMLLNLKVVGNFLARMLFI